MTNPEEKKITGKKWFEKDGIESTKCIFISFGEKSSIKPTDLTDDVCDSLKALKYMNFYGRDPEKYDSASEWKFPQKFKKIPLLRLFFRNTNIKDFNNIPDTIEQMEIDYANSITEINELPANLKICKINECGLNYLPVSISKCKSLTLLKLTNCKNLTCLPDDICELSELSELTIGSSSMWHSSSISQLPRGIGRLSMLNTLDLTGCKQLIALPDSVCDCPLTSLVIDSCGGLKYLPDRIGYPPNLKISMKECPSIEDIPCSLVSLMGNPLNDDFTFKNYVVKSKCITYTMCTMRCLPSEIVTGGHKSIFCYMRPKEYMRRWLMYVLCTRKLKKMRLPPELIQIICNDYMGLDVECY
jgi:hypothetical protein